MVKFSKYSATGNDFVMIDNRSGSYDTGAKNFWQKICHRRFGIGADGVIFLEKSEAHDFRMKYLNADGNEVSMCGNGTRALSHFYTQLLNETSGHYSFETKNGIYTSKVSNKFAVVEMTEYYDIQKIDLSAFKEKTKAIDFYYSNTGVPHAIFLVDDVSKIDVFNLGREIRNNKIFSDGVNVNFISFEGSDVYVRTYERGVEDETLSCGTGITAAVRFLWDKKLINHNKVDVTALGGRLSVIKDDGKVFFGGEVDKIFEGELCTN